MSKRLTPRPTDAELAILRVLWRRGSSTVREVHERLRRSNRTAYTTTLKLMQIMTDKGLLSRDESERAHVYRPTLSQERTLRHLARDLLERAFGGSMEKLVVHALQARKASAEELTRIRDLLDELEGTKR